jgi:ribonuclease Z
VSLIRLSLSEATSGHSGTGMDFMTVLTFLGTSGSVLTKKRACAGFIFEDKLVDIGFGVLTNILKSGMALDEIHELYISHTHSYHIGDFTGLVWAMAMGGRTDPLQVICSAGVASSLKKILELQSTPASGFVNFEISFITPEQANVVFQKTIHDPENLAYKFKINKTDLVYTGDTAKYDAVSKFALGCDILIHDSTFLSGQEALAKLTNHSTANEAAEIAKQAQVGKLVMTHISPTNEGLDQKYISEAERVFKNEAIVAKDWLKLEI